MKVTAAICTWNRADLLDKTLTRMRKLCIPQGTTWELLVVNNNCSDRTDEVIAGHAEHLPIRRLFEPQPGHSNARNCAVRQARGELLIWTDDDVLVEVDWLVEYVRAAEQWPDAAFFGGPVRPWFEGEPPAWLADSWHEIGGALALCDFADEPFRFDARVLPFGANFAIRTSWQRRYAYDPKLGRKGDELLSGDETAVLRRIVTTGGDGWWVPTARVQHFIPKCRQTIRYLRRFYIGHSQTVLKMGGAAMAPMLFGKPRWAWRSAVESEIKYRMNRLLGRRSDKWIGHLIMASAARGFLLGQ